MNRHTVKSNNRHRNWHKRQIHRHTQREGNGQTQAELYKDMERTTKTDTGDEIAIESRTVLNIKTRK